MVTWFLFVLSIHVWEIHVIKDRQYKRKIQNFYFVSIRLFLILTFLCVTRHLRAKHSKFSKLVQLWSSNSPQQHDISMRWNCDFVEEGLGFKYTIYFGVLHFHFWRIWKSTWPIKSCGTKWLAPYTKNLAVSPKFVMTNFGAQTINFSCNKFSGAIFSK
jgi:hypothetical protein